jgi:hypothetical protein
MRKNKIEVPLCIMAILLHSTICQSQPRRRSSAGKATSETTDIRKVDFKNFSYSAKADRGRDYSFRLRNGRYTKQVAPQDIHSTIFDRVVYGDLTHDGKDEALVLLLDISEQAVLHNMFTSTQLRMGRCLSLQTSPAARVDVFLRERNVAS